MDCFSNFSDIWLVLDSKLNFMNLTILTLLKDCLPYLLGEFRCSKVRELEVLHWSNRYRKKLFYNSQLPPYESRPKLTYFSTLKSKSTWLRASFIIKLLSGSCYSPFSLNEVNIHILAKVSYKAATNSYQLSGDSRPSSFVSIFS